jgi:hypothetical protein
MIWRSRSAHLDRVAATAAASASTRRFSSASAARVSSISRFASITCALRGGDGGGGARLSSRRRRRRSRLDAGALRLFRLELRDDAVQSRFVVRRALLGVRDGGVVRSHCLAARLVCSRRRRRRSRLLQARFYV